MLKLRDICFFCCHALKIIELVDDEYCPKCGAYAFHEPETASIGRPECRRFHISIFNRLQFLDIWKQLEADTFFGFERSQVDLIVEGDVYLIGYKITGDFLDKVGDLGHFKLRASEVLSEDEIIAAQQETKLQDAVPINETDWWYNNPLPNLFDESG